MKKSIRQRDVPQEVADNLAAIQGDKAGTLPCAAQPPEGEPLSFAKDISPIFEPFRGPMAWRLDLTDYQAVLGNANLIYNMISDPDNPMPPPPFQPLTQDQIKMFNDWMGQGCPP